MKNNAQKILCLLITAVVLLTAMSGIVAEAAVAETTAVSKYQTVKVGIDVSFYQGDIDWNQVKNEVDFAILRIGNTGYGSSGSLNYDVKFDEYVAGATAAGIPIGVYYYGCATTVEKAVAEANFVLEKLAEYPSIFSYPIIYDVETSPEYNSEAYKIATEASKAFCDTIRAAGYYPMVYSYTGYFNPYITTADISNYDFWQAHYYDSDLDENQNYKGLTPYELVDYSGNRPSIQGNYDSNISIWQCTSQGSVAGISGDVDCNISYFDYDAFIKDEGYNGYTTTDDVRTATCTGEVVNVRSGASTAFDVIGQAVLGDEFDVKCIYNKTWIEIDFNGQTGYVHSDYFTVEDTVDADAPETPDVEEPSEDETPDVEEPSEDETPDVENPSEDETPDVETPSEDETPDVEEPSVDEGEGEETEEERPGLFQRIGQAFANLFKMIGNFFKALFGGGKK